MPRRRRPPRAGALSELPPLKILSQIFLLQAGYYISATILILFTALVAGKRFSPDLILSWRSLRGDTTVGWMLGLVWGLNSLVGVILLLLLITRSKLIPDFALTLHFLHLIVTSLYSRSLPTNWLWWLLQALSAALMTSLGVWTCQKRELRPINFGGGGREVGSGSQGGREGDVGRGDYEMDERGGGRRDDDDGG